MKLTPWAPAVEPVGGSNTTASGCRPRAPSSPYSELSVRATCWQCCERTNMNSSTTTLPFRLERAKAALPGAAIEKSGDGRGSDAARATPVRASRMAVASAGRISSLLPTGNDALHFDGGDACRIRRRALTLENTLDHARHQRAGEDLHVRRTRKAGYAQIRCPMQR